MYLLVLVYRKSYHPSIRVEIHQPGLAFPGHHSVQNPSDFSYGDISVHDRFSGHHFLSFE
jgi:hypothetical protein